MELLVSSSLDQNPVFLAANLTPCDNNTDCESFVNGECLNSFCECNGTRFCEDKVATVVTKIGEFCKIKADCNIEHSVCEKDKCACAEGRVEAPNGRKCLKSSEPPCIGSSSCDWFDSGKRHSNCVPGRCECEEERPFCTNGVEEFKKKVKPTEKPKKPFDWNRQIDIFNLPHEDKMYLRSNAYYILSCLILSYYLLYTFNNNEFRRILVRYVTPVYVYFIITFSLWLVDVDNNVYGYNLLTLTLVTLGFIVLCLFSLSYRVLTAMGGPGGVHPHQQPANIRIVPEFIPRGRRRRRRA